MKYTLEDLEGLLDCTGLMIVILDQFLNCTYINAYAHSMLERIQEKKYSKETIIGKPLSKLWQIDEEDELESYIKKVLQEGEKVAKVSKIIGRRYYLETGFVLIPLEREDKTVKGCILIGRAIKMHSSENSLVKQALALEKGFLSGEVEVDIYYKIFRGLLEKTRNNFSKIKFNTSGKEGAFAVYYYDLKKQAFILHFAVGYFQKYKEHNRIYRVKEELIKEAIFRGKYGRVKKLGEDQPGAAYLEGLDEEGVKYIIEHPIMVDGRLLGMIIYATKEEKEEIYYEQGGFYNIVSNIILIIKGSLLVEKYTQETKAYRRMAEKNRLLFEGSECLLCILDSNGKLIKINKKWEQLLGYTEETFKEVSFWKVMGIQESSHSIEALEECYFKKGRCVWINWNIQRKNLNNKEVILVIGIDVTEERLALERSREIKGQLEKEKVKSQIFATLSHEFKTPLNVILLVTQLMSKDLQNSSHNKHHERIGLVVKGVDKSAYKLLKISNDLIDLTRIDMANYDLSYDRYNIVSVIQEMIRQIEYHVKDRPIIFNTTLEEKDIECDITNMERIITNLMSYALKKAVEGEEIVVQLTEEEMLKLSIFYREQSASIGTNSKERMEEEIGYLNLDIAEKVANLQGGSISYEEYSRDWRRIIFKYPKEVKGRRESSENYKAEELWGKNKLHIELSDIS